jgi:hypothetical protein
LPREDLRKFASKRTAGVVRPHYVDLTDPETGKSGGAASHPFAKTATGVSNQFGGASVIRTVARPYHPLFSSPDRLQLPVQLAQLNQYWRLFYNVDPVIGGVIDMHAEMPFSNASLIMDQVGDNSKEILHAFEDMMTETELLSWLPRIAKEYHIIGEVFPYMFWDQDEGIWSHITIHNPDYVEVVDSPLIDDDPILTLRPSQDMRKILQSTDPRYIRLRQKLPAEIVTMLAGGKNLPLDPLNASHIKRLAFPYDIRGTSIMGRMFRVLMYEDAVFNGQIQQAQRHALPLRVFKLGDPNSGWMPTPSNQEDFAQLLAEVEVDPLAAIIYSYALQVEYHGIEGKQLKITQEWDVIERAKLVALGVSKAFLHGEVTYASANAGLQVLMMRYRTFRDMLLNDWIYKKVFATMSELRGFYRDPKKSDPESALPETRDPQLEKQTMFLRDRLMQIKSMKDPDEQAYEYVKLKPILDAHNAATHRRYIPMNRVAGAQRSKVKKKKHLLYPQLQFEKRLDVRQDENILNLWIQMASMGWVSPRTIVQGAGLDYDSEMATIGQDAAQIMRNQLLMQSLGGGEGGPGGGGGGSPMGGIGIGPDATTGLGPEGGEGKGAPGSAGGETGPGSKATVKSQQRKITAAGLPPDIRGEIEALVKDDGNVEIFVKG